MFSPFRGIKRGTHILSAVLKTVIFYFNLTAIRVLETEYYRSCSQSYTTTQLSHLFFTTVLPEDIFLQIY